jgi:hypothetical protein
MKPGLYEYYYKNNNVPSIVEVYNEKGILRCRKNKNITGFKITDIPYGNYLKPLKYLACG